MAHHDGPASRTAGRHDAGSLTVTPMRRWGSGGSSIVDLAGGHQPLSNEDGTVWVAFNGEIYNFPALRRAGLRAGHTLHSHGDTEAPVRPPRR